MKSSSAGWMWRYASLRRRAGPCRPARCSLRGGGLGSPLALLVGVHGLLQIAVLRAREPAELVEPGQMLFGLGQVVELQVGLTDVLGGPAMIGINGEGLRVEGNGRGRVAVLARGIRLPVVCVGIRRVSRRDVLEQADRRGILAGLDALHCRSVVGVDRPDGLATTATAASTATTTPAGGESRQRCGGQHEAEHDPARRKES